jgi:hypothetical protein
MDYHQHAMVKTQPMLKKSLIKFVLEWLLSTRFQNLIPLFQQEESEKVDMVDNVALMVSDNSLMSSFTM